MGRTHLRVCLNQQYIGCMYEWLELVGCIVFVWPGQLYMSYAPLFVENPH